MEGRHPPPPIDELPNDVDPPVAPLPLPPGRHNHDTYIVQVPKDQVYRVPPPENALIVEKHRKPPVKKKKPRSRCCTICLSLIAIIAIIAIILTAIFFVFRPKEPAVSIANFEVKKYPTPGKKNSRPQYEISLAIKNPGRLGLEYDKNAEVLLLFENTKVGRGKFPWLDQEGDASTLVKIELAGEAMPRKMEKSMNDTKSNIPISFNLDMKLGVRVKAVGAKIKSNVNCKFQVSRLRKDSHLLSEECHADSKK